MITTEINISHNNIELKKLGGALNVLDRIASARSITFVYNQPYQATQYGIGYINYSGLPYLTYHSLSTPKATKPEKPDRA